MSSWQELNSPYDRAGKVLCAGCSACPVRDACSRRNGDAQVEQIAKWGGSALSFVGSLLLATTQSAGTSPFVFLLFLVANTAWVVAGLSMRDRALVTTSLLGVAFNLSATFIRL